jgi:signal transduction histidine kinase
MRAEEALTRRESQFHDLIVSSADAMIVLDEDGVACFLNPAAERLLGLSAEELVGELVGFPVIGGETTEVDILHSGGEIRITEMRVANTEWDGKTAYIASFRDITLRKRAEEALATLHAELEERVQERTAELAQAVEALQQEVIERVQAEEKQISMVLEERTRIARDIHDTLAQGFTGIVIQLEVAEDALADDPEAARAHLLRARSLARESLAEARRSVWALRPEILEQPDLVSSIASLVSDVTRESPLSIEFTNHGTPRPLLYEMENDLLRLCQEALTNALRHARAANLRVALTFDPQHVQLCVEDDGQGFDPSLQPHSRGFGLQGMQERVERWGGNLTLASQPGQGTRLMVRVPVREPA